MLHHDLGHRPAGAYLPGLQQHQRVGQPRHLVHGVGDIQHGDLQPVAQRLQPGQYVLLAGAVQRRQRLVQQQHARLARQRPRNRHPLALAAGQRVHPPLQQAANTQQRHRLIQTGMRRRVTLYAAPAAQPENQVLAHIQMRKQTGFLKDIAQGTLPSRNEHAVGFVLPNRTGHGHVGIQPIAGALQPGHTAQQGGFARTRGPE